MSDAAELPTKLTQMSSETTAHDLIDAIAHLVPDGLRGVLKRILADEIAVLLVALLPLASVVLEIVRRYCCGCHNGRQAVVMPTLGSRAAARIAPASSSAGLAMPPGSIYPLSRAQRAAALAAAVAQDAIALAASKATKEEQARADPKWTRNGGASAESLLPSAPLLDAHYLLALADAGGILPPYEEVPQSARLDASSVWRLRCWPASSSLPILAVSMPSLDPAHPDPDGAQLQRLVPVMRAMLTEARRDKALTHATVGVLVPYCSCVPRASPAFDADDGAWRALRHAAVQHRIAWFAHPCTHVLLLGREAGGAAAESGWPAVEEGAACLVKYSPNLWAMPAGFDGSDRYALLYERLRARRRPLTSPERMRQRLGRGGGFSEAAGTAEEAAAAYERGFKECFEQFKRVVPGRTQLLYTHAGWTSEDAGQVVEALRYASAHCAKPASSGADHLVVHLYEGNAFGFDAAEALRAALRDSAILKLFTGATSTAQPGSPQKATAPERPTTSRAGRLGMSLTLSRR